MFPLDYEQVPDKHEIKDIRWVHATQLADGSIGAMNRTLRFFVAKHLHKFVQLPESVVSVAAP